MVEEAEPNPLTQRLPASGSVTFTGVEVPHENVIGSISDPAPLTRVSAALGNCVKRPSGDVLICPGGSVPRSLRLEFGAHQRHDLGSKAGR